MQERVSLAFLHSRGSANDNHRGFFREGARGGIGHLQPADAIGHTHSAQAFHARIAIGCEARALLIAGDDDLEVAGDKLIIEAEHIVAWNAENMSYTKRPQATDKVLADRRPLRKAAIRRFHFLRWSRNSTHDSTL